MALPLAMVRYVLSQKGAVINFNSGPHTSALNVKGAKADLINKIMYNYYPCSTHLDFKGITFTGVPDSSPQANAANVAYEADWATLGLVDAPGYIFTDSMSGCAFYLYRGFGDSVAGVHASRQSGKLMDPTPYFQARASKPLYVWDSLGKLTGPMQGCFGAVLCCVDLDTIHIHVLALKGRSLQAVLERSKIDNWRTATNPVVQPL